jgi:hypothetical protein
MNALTRLFYTAMLWATQLELALAMSAPNRNYPHIATLRRDEDEYRRALLRLELNL